jgi:hypothetical protein
MATKKTQASTQKFTQLEDIVDDVVLYEGGSASLVIEVSSTNFALLSYDEQQSRIQAYAGFLNSLTSSIQIIINNRRINISAYLSLLDDEINKSKDNIVTEYMQLYKSFVAQLVKENVVLDKRFYIVIPYSYLEGGAVKTVSATAKSTPKEETLIGIKTALHAKADGIRNQLSRINLQTKILEKDDLMKLFHQMYNPEESSATGQNTLKSGVPPVIEVKKEEKK